MTRAQSMGVINDATTLESRIDAVLAAPIMEWDHSPEIGWQPGDSLWPHPFDRDEDEGNFPRPIAEIVGLGEYYDGLDEDGSDRYVQTYYHDDTLDGALVYVDCTDCMVGIGVEETHCWNCGKMLMVQSKKDLWEEMNRTEAVYFERMRAAMFNSATMEMRRQDRLILTGTAFEGESRLRGISDMGGILDEIVWPQQDPWPADFFEYSAQDAAATASFYHSALWGDGRPLDPMDDSLYNHSYSINLDPIEPLTPDFLRRALTTPRRHGRTEYLRDQLNLYMATREQPAPLPEVPRINLRDTNPDLYRPWYERYFESENTNAATQHRRSHSRLRSEDRRPVRL